MERNELMKLSRDIETNDLKIMALRQTIATNKEMRDINFIELDRKLKEDYEKDKENFKHLSSEAKRKPFVQSNPQMQQLLEDIKQFEIHFQELSIKTESMKREFRIWTM